MRAVGLVLVLVVPTLSCGCSALLGIDSPGNAGDDADAGPPDASTTPDAALPGVVFQNRRFVATASDPADVAVADIDGNSTLDLVVANRGAATVSVLLGNGDGTFAPKQDLLIQPEGEAGPDSVALLDWEADGAIDILVSVRGAPFQLKGSIATPGTFAAPIIQGAGDGDDPRGDLFAPLVGDVRVDHVVCAEDHASVFMQSDSGLADTVSVSFPAAASRPARCGVAAGHFSGVGAGPRADLVVACGQGMLLRHDGDLLDFNAPVPLATGPDIVAAAVADVDSDGLDDVAFAGGATGNLLVLQDGRTPGQFRPELAFDDKPGYADVAIGALAGGPLLDVAYVDRDHDELVIYLDDGDAMHWRLSPLVDTGDGPVALVLADLDEDEKTDVVTVDATAGGISIFLQQ